jgi:hypothetical protein
MKDIKKRKINYLIKFKERAKINIEENLGTKLSAPHNNSGGAHTKDRATNVRTSYNFGHIPQKKKLYGY